MGQQNACRKPCDFHDNQLQATERLLSASRSGNAVAVVLALQEGAKIEGRIALRKGAGEGSKDAQQRSQGVSALMYAALEGHTDIVKILLDANADVKSMDATGLRPLHYAAMGPSLMACTVLVAACANPDEMDDDEQTAYDLIPPDTHGNKQLMNQLRDVLKGPSLPEVSSGKRDASSMLSSGMLPAPPKAILAAQSSNGTQVAL